MACLEASLFALLVQWAGQLQGSYPLQLHWRGKPRACFRSGKDPSTLRHSTGTFELSYSRERRCERTRYHFSTMLGFSLPLYVLLGVELTLAGLLCLPLPISRPAIFIVRLTKHQVGRSIVGTIALFLVVLMASPVYDIYSLHQQKHRSADNLMSQERRETEASSNLSLTLTGTCLALLLIIRQLGLSLADLDDLRTKYEPNGAPEVKIAPKKVE